MKLVSIIMDEVIVLMKINIWSKITDPNYTSKNKNEFSLTRATWINHWGHRPHTLSHPLLEEE